ncbi:peptide chain release factor H [Roseibium sp. MMSF_3544]|uniref:peptide chain release factor H n=1 Tax=unclassified Roseibium TaxID=2629323 RepID=UPI00273DD934|nr:peptide chain release factor H [Roseibium sp. MMSF_3544]
MSSFDPHHLLVTSGNGPQECRRAVALVLQKMQKEAQTAELVCHIEVPIGTGSEDPASALVSFSGAAADKFAKRWTGTVQWICKSPFRPHHKRQNWFVGVFEVNAKDIPELDLSAGAVRIETFRSGGPGGQHQNTTDSGVRITHLASGLSAVSTDERSQHRNRQVAIARLKARFLLKREEELARDRSDQNQLHRQLERGNAVRVFKGARFAEQTEGKSRN